VLSARRISEIAYEDMLALANGGAAVLQAKSILIAKEHDVKLRVLSSFSMNGETRIVKKTTYVSTKHKVTGIAHNLTLSVLTLTDNLAVPQVIDLLQHIDLIQIKQSNFFIFPKSHQSELENFLHTRGISFKIDNDVGVITIVVGWQEEVSVLLEEVMAEITRYHYQVKHVFSRDNSISVILQFQQIYDALNVLHRFFFE
jgi:aspartokinase